MSVKEGVTLNRESVATYTMLVTATDSGDGTGENRETSVTVSTVEAHFLC